MTQQQWSVVASVVASLLVPGTLLALFLHARRRDIRVLRNGFLALFLFYSLATLVASAVSAFHMGQTVVTVVRVVLFGAVLLGLLALPALLVANGLRMLSREGRSLGNLLSLAAGVGMLGAPVLAIGLLALDTPWSLALAAALVVAVAWFGFVFLGFLVHTLLYAHRVRNATGNAVIVLGSQLVRDRVAPLLAGRLEAGMRAAARSSSVTGREVPIVTSGGRGDDEVRPEGEGMAQWLLEQGVDPDQVIVEDVARTTEENLVFSVRLLQARGIQGPYLVATSNYHAPRAALHALDLDLDAQAVGGPTARYFLPSAYLREFVAVLRARPATLVGAAVLAVPFAFVAFRAAMLRT